MKLTPVSLLLVPLLVVAAAGIVKAAPGETRSNRAAAERNARLSAEDPDPGEDADADDPPAGQPGMWMGGGGWMGGGFGMHRGPGMQGGGFEGRRMMGPIGLLLHGGGPLAERLNLTGTQREKLRGIGDDLARKMIRSRADLQLARLDLAELLAGDNPSRTAVEERVDAVSRIQASMAKTAITARLDAREVLTAEQWKQLREMRPGAGWGARQGAERPRAGQRPGQGQGQGQGRARAHGWSNP